MSEEEKGSEEMLLVAISVMKDKYNIKFNPFVPDKILIDALESALAGLKEDKAETKINVDVKIGEQKQ